MIMKRMNQLINTTMSSLKDAVLKAVPAVSSKNVLPRWRNLGRSITPYHFMQPVPIPVQQKKK